MTPNKARQTVGYAAAALIAVERIDKVNSHIWRYMDLAKFIHVLATKTLHFTRIDQFKDKFEGSYPIQNLRDWELQYPEVGNFSHWRKFACVSCWYESDNESAAMWELYGKDNQGLAIQSTKERLKKSVESDEVTFDKVKYVNFIKEKADIHIPLDVFLYKRTEFECEREYRAALFDLPKSDGTQNGFPNFGSVEKQEGYPKVGKDISVDLEILIEKIVLSPYAMPWYKKAVADVLMKYHISGSILVESELSSDPVYPRQ